MFQFRLATAEPLVSLGLKFVQTRLGLRLQLLLALLELDLSRFFAALHFQFPAHVDFAGTVLDLTLEIGLAEPGTLIDFAFFLRELGVEGNSQFLFTLFSAMFIILLTLAEGLFELELLPLQMVFLLT